MDQKARRDNCRYLHLWLTNIDCSSRTPCNASIYYVLHGFARQIMAYLLSEYLNPTQRGFMCGATNMWCDNHVWEGYQGTQRALLIWPEHIHSSSSQVL